MSDEQLERAAAFEFVTGTHLIRISITGGDPAEAKTVADTYARVFVADRTRSAQAFTRGGLRDLSTEIRGLSARITGLREARRSRRTADRLQVLESQLTAAQQSYATLRQNALQQNNNVKVASLAARPTAPSKPKPALYLAVGIVLALAFATIAALFRNAVDRRFRSEEELERVVAAPVLARIPRRRDGMSLEREVEFLRANLELHNRAGRTEMVLLTSADDDADRHSISQQLARSFAAAGIETVFLESHLGKPSSPGSQQGRSDVLAGTARLEDVLTSAGEHLTVAHAGRASGTKASPSAGTVGAVVDDLRARYSAIVCDTFPVTSAPEPSMLAALSDAVVLVVDVRRTKRDDVTAAREQISRAGARLTGIVLDGVSHGRPIGSHRNQQHNAPLNERASREPTPAHAAN